MTRVQGRVTLSRQGRKMKELSIIKSIRRRAEARSGRLETGIGDDCAVFDNGGGKCILWCQDMLVEGTHFRLRDGYRNIGRKAVAVNISDIAAMGGRPGYVSVGLGVPEKVSVRTVKKIYDGIFGICDEYGITLAGGDTVRSEKVVIDVSMAGVALKKNVTRRSGAKAGELILITGPVRDGRREHLRFRPRLEESGFLAGKYRPGAMIDTSDGIAPDIRRVCEESRTGCRLYEGSIPLDPGTRLEDALYYGESFELLFTMDKSRAGKLLRDKRFGGQCPFFVVGEITRREEGLKIIGPGGKVSALGRKSFGHFT